MKYLGKTEQGEVWRIRPDAKLVDGTGKVRLRLSRSSLFRFGDHLKIVLSAIRVTPERLHRLGWECDCEGRRKRMNEVGRAIGYRAVTWPVLGPWLACAANRWPEPVPASIGAPCGKCKPTSSRRPDNEMGDDTANSHTRSR